MNKFHPIIEYLEAQDWDGTKRIDTLFIDYLGADNTPIPGKLPEKCWWLP
nr:hypothetical protein [Paenibacillus larvae]